MSDFIDKQAALNAVGLTTWAGSRISKLDTIDAVPVVRCKDCKWYESAHLKRDGTVDKRYKSNVCVRGTFAKLRKADWYCADGERREDD